jgi:GAF domain-containing protein
MDEHMDNIQTVLQELSSLILSEENIETTLQRVAKLAVRVIPNVEAGLTLLENGKPVSWAATSDWVIEIDRIQYSKGVGPCLAAISDMEQKHAPNLPEDSQWDGFSEEASQHGLNSVLAIPLVVANQSLGSLNLYSTEVDGFDEESVHLATMFAQQAGVAVHNSQLYYNSVKLSQQLEEALVSRAVIDQAKGILMEREGVNADEAFEMLRKASQELNLKVRDIARQIVDGPTRGRENQGED